VLPRRSLATALAAAALLALTASGCAFKEPGVGREAATAGVKEGKEVPGAEPVREGVGIGLEGLTYTVFITRELNPQDPEDRDYYQGPPPPPGTALYGIFFKTCNDGKTPAMAAKSFKVSSTQGQEFKPVTLPKTNIFAYRPSSLSAKQCIPNELSTAAQAPSAGALIIFELPITATENRPMELEIAPPSGKGDPARVELDI
jgi:hypothetical protein